MDHGGGGGGAAPTGCYKCGRPGHWSRDCPSNPNSASNDLNPSSNNSKSAFNSGGDATSSGKLKSNEKPKKVPRSRPKLTPEILLSNDGLGYVLRHFPKAFKFHGRGHEVQDLGNLLGLYSEWHSHLIPYYSFDQFVHKVEQVSSTKRVKLCLRDLRDRVSHGGDPTKLHDGSVQHESHDISNQEQEAINVEEPSPFLNMSSVQNQDADDLHDVDDFQDADVLHNVDDFQDAMLHDMYENVTEDPSQALHNDIITAAVSAPKELPNPEPGNVGRNSAEDQISEELKARIEANRLKALDRAAARAKSSQAP